MRFTNSATILSNGQIKLKAIELLHQDHITAIKKLEKAGLFPPNLTEEKGIFQFDPKSMEVTIQMIDLDEVECKCLCIEWNSVDTNKIKILNHVTPMGFRIYTRTWKI